MANEIDNQLYEIVRFFASGSKRIIRRNQTLAMAQAHCKNKEASSTTCTKPENKRRTRRSGNWFDGYRDQ